MKNDNLPLKRNAKWTENWRGFALMLQPTQKPVITDDVEKMDYERQQFTNNRTFLLTTWTMCLPPGASYGRPSSKNAGENKKNAALFLRLGFRSTLIRRENGALRGRSSKQRNLRHRRKTLLSVSSLTEFNTQKLTNNRYLP